MAGRAQGTCRIGLAQERGEVVAVHIVTGAAFDRPGVEFDFIGRGSAPTLLGIGRHLERRILGRGRVGDGDRVVVAEVGTEHQRSPLAAVEIRVAALAVGFGSHIGGGMAGWLYQVVLGTDAVAVNHRAGVHAVVTTQTQARRHARLADADVHRWAAIQGEDLRGLGAVPERRLKVGIGPVRGVTELADLRRPGGAQIMARTDHAAAVQS